jgi:uncharacterized protein (TIGR02186 family)
VSGRAPIVGFVAALMCAGSAGAEQLTIALSTSEVKISSNFTGTNITVFGVIQRDAATVSRTTGYQVVTLMLGPPETVVARRKDRILGIWINSASATFLQAPSFYAMNASAPIEQISSEATLRRLGLGFANVTFINEGAQFSPGVREFREAFLRLKQQNGLFYEEGGIDFFGDSVFRATVRIPANVPVGRYTVLVYLFADNALLARADDRIDISKTGFEQFMFAFAGSQSLLYGVVCVALAVLIGWLGGVIFRRD